MAKGLRLLYDMDKYFDWADDKQLKELCLDLVFAYSLLPVNSSTELITQIDLLEWEILQMKIKQDRSNNQWLSKYQHCFACFRTYSETDELGRINYG